MPYGPQAVAIAPPANRSGSLKSQPRAQSHENTLTDKIPTHLMNGLHKRRRGVPDDAGIAFQGDDLRTIFQQMRPRDILQLLFANMDKIFMRRDPAYII